MHSIILSGLFEAKLEHKNCPFIFADSVALYIWLLYQNPKLTVFIPPKASYAHIRIRKNRIVDYNTIKGKT